MQYAIGVSLNKKCFREIVVVLEWSENEHVLSEIYKGVEEVTNQDVQVGLATSELFYSHSGD